MDIKYFSINAVCNLSNFEFCKMNTAIYWNIYIVSLLILVIFSFLYYSFFLNVLVQKALDLFSARSTKENIKDWLGKRRGIHLCITLVMFAFSLFLPIIFDGATDNKDLILSGMKILGEYWFLVNCAFLSVSCAFFVLSVADLFVLSAADLQAGSAK